MIESKPVYTTDLPMGPPRLNWVGWDSTAITESMWIELHSPPEGSPADLLERIEQLEARVVELEAEAK